MAVWQGKEQNSQQDILKKLKQFLEKVTPLGFRHILKGDFMDNIEFKKIVQEITSKYEVMYCKKNYYCNIR